MSFFRNCFFYPLFSWILVMILSSTIHCSAQGNSYIAEGNLTKLTFFSDQTIITNKFNYLVFTATNCQWYIKIDALNDSYHYDYVEAGYEGGNAIYGLAYYKNPPPVAVAAKGMVPKGGAVESIPILWAALAQNCVLSNYLTFGGEYTDPFSDALPRPSIHIEANVPSDSLGIASKIIYFAPNDANRPLFRSSNSNRGLTNSVYSVTAWHNLSEQGRFPKSFQQDFFFRQNEEPERIVYRWLGTVTNISLNASVQNVTPAWPEGDVFFADARIGNFDNTIDIRGLTDWPTEQEIRETSEYRVWAARTSPPVSKPPLWIYLILVALLVAPIWLVVKRSQTQNTHQ